MIKLVYCVRRRADVTPEKFHDYWLNTHGPKVRSVAEAINALRYVQSHTSETPSDASIRKSRRMSAPYDGITEVWFQDAEHMNEAGLTDEGVAAGKFLIEDEARFIDLERSTAFITEEHEIFDLRA